MTSTCDNIDISDQRDLDIVSKNILEQQFLTELLN